MSPQVPSYLTTASPEYFIIAEAQEKDLITNFMKMIVILQIFEDFILHIILFACIYVLFLQSVLEGNKRESDTLEQELQVVMSHSLGARNQIKIFCRSSVCF